MSKKLVDNPKEVVNDLIEGLVLAYPGLLRVKGHNVVIRSDIEEHKRSNRVSLVCGGGSGHEPAHAGFVGKGMLSGAVLGGVFASPSVDTILAGIQAVCGPAGCLVIVKNYTGDCFNFNMAADMARVLGLKVEVVIVGDDVALSKNGNHAGRRGLAGTIMVQKVAGAAAEASRDLSTVAELARASAGCIRTMGVALGACVIPEVGKPAFELKAGEIELGLGIHGEAGIRKGSIRPASDIVNEILKFIMEDFEQDSYCLNDVALMVNNLGGTSNMEMAIVARDAITTIESKYGVQVSRVYIGTFMSAMEMAGVSLSLLPVTSERARLLDAPTSATAWISTPARPKSKIEVTVPENQLQAKVSGIPPGTSPLPWIQSGLNHVMEAVAREQKNLTDLDAVVGDGDLGISLQRGIDALELELQEKKVPLHDLVSSLEYIALSLQRNIGGSSGPLIGVFLLRAAMAIQYSPSTESGKALVNSFEAGLSGIVEMGRAKVGDRTMVDALSPALDAMKVAPPNSIKTILAAALDGARRGTEATRRMKPKLGRSSYLGDRVLGHPDGGAQLVCIIIEALLSSV